MRTTGNWLRNLWSLLLAAMFAAGPLSPASAAGADPDRAEPGQPLFTMVVTASRLDGRWRDVTVLDARELERAGAVTVSDALRLAPEISILQYGPRGAVEQVAVRGAGPAPALILVNAAPVSGESAAGLLKMPLVDVDYIEISKGSLLHGGAGGAINIVTTAAASLAGTRVSSVSRFGERDVTALEGSSQGEGNLLVTASHAVRPGALQDGSDRDRYVRLRVDRTLSPTSTGSLTFTWISGEAEAPGTAEVPSPGAAAFDTTASADLSYRYDLPQGVLQASAFARRSQLGEGDDAGLLEHEDLALGGGLHATLSLRAGELAAGIEAETVSVESDRLVEGTHRADRRSAYAQFGYALSEAAQLTVGARVDAHAHYDPALLPRLELYYAPLAETSFRASVARSFRPPTFDDLYGVGVGDPLLRPEQGWDYRVGLARGLSWGKVDVSLFRRQLEDRIHWLPDDAGIRRPQNLAASTTDGLELTVSTPLAERVVMSFRGTLRSDRDALSGGAIPYVPSLEARWGIQYAGERTRGNFELQFLGPQPDGLGSGIAALAVANGRIVHAASRYLDIFAEGLNLFDAGGENGGPFATIPGRTLFVGASLSF